LKDLPVTSFAHDIRPMFSDLDVPKMSWAFDLTAFADVKAHASEIRDRIQGIGGDVMPPPGPKGDGPWLQPAIDIFEKWVSEGCPP
jgi:hypothetical protein